MLMPSKILNSLNFKSRPATFEHTTLTYFAASRLKIGKKRVLCDYGVDLDAVAGWLGSYGGEDSSNDLNLGLFAGTIGTRRLLGLFEKNNMKATWFFPGHALETFPEECAMIQDAGHEIGLHGYTNENPTDMSIEAMRRA